MEAGKSKNFPTTDWPLIQSASLTGSREHPNRSLGKIVALYIPALRRYLVMQKHVGEHDVDDIIQDFISDKFLAASILDSADANRGRFRNLLVRALENYLVSRIRKENAQVRSPAGRAVIPLNVEAHSIGSHDADPASAFDCAWAESVVQKALSKTKQRCVEKNREVQWNIFVARMLPESEDATPSYDELVAKFNLSGPVEASTAMITCKRMFERNLRKALSEFVPLEDAAFAEEISALKKIFGDRRA